ncbi:predicted protein [Scheffersomyces stipitis CBS 6054]|uniref:RGS domain-containing protein n=1 Tax=Scheffersomyces stipitis (strain ATCC 58785 / CBS 6054 / NBRC 10063 / NRRL Y-11545) TaxID=322104 RepID=A3LXU6_PICST|nr:predicted protein [Scheffersomyces stipitis CBS 6054]ABN67863.2 predicted protein [Scheffersomyces stipitis CBS 6054]KAG2732144.1 hypothetical protein G9P44_004561 [Scheffersomyces stipitis]
MTSPFASSGEPVHVSSNSSGSTVIATHPPIIDGDLSNELNQQGPIFNYSINNNQSIHIIPSLDDLLDDSKSKDNYYTKQNFIEFLSNIHCVENLEFVMEVNELIRHLGSDLALVKWQSMYENFISINSISEINLPCMFRQQFNYNDIPSHHLLAKCKRIIYDDILINLYNEFIKATKSRMDNELKNSNIVYRRKSEIISPESSAVIDYSSNSSPVSNATIKKARSPSYLDPAFYPDLFARNCNTDTTYMILDESIINGDDEDDEDDEDMEGNSRATFSHDSTRNNSSSSQTSNSRGSSIGSIMDSFKNVDYIKFAKVKKFKFRRASNDE